MNINIRSVIIVIHDLFLSVFSLFSAFFIYHNFIYHISIHSILNLDSFFFSIFIFFHLAGCYIFKTYRIAWRFINISDLKIIAFSSLLPSLFIFLANEHFLKLFNEKIPYQVLVIYPMILILTQLTNRIIYNSIFLKDNKVFSKKKNKKNVIIFTTNIESMSFVLDLKNSAEWSIVGVFVNDNGLSGRNIFGIKIYSKFSDLSKLILKFPKLTHAIICMPSSSSDERRAVFNICKKYKLQVLSLPNSNDLLSGRISINELSNFRLEDLLRRDPVNLNNSGLMKLLQNQTIFVSGSGGSIGSEICRQLLKFKPRVLICFDNSEFMLYKLQEELNNNYDKAHTKVLYLVGDIRDRILLNKIFHTHNPKIIYHAAAYKHVPMMENENLSQALSNNVYGTYILSKVAVKYNVNKFVLISSDKAVNPTNIMGVSKRLSEILCKSFNSSKTTSFISVRFGNVLGSSGSVIPKFYNQIKKGGPLTVTDKKITRYFMLIPEAVRLVMQSSLIGNNGNILVLNMGKPVKVYDLAKDIIRLSGKTFDEIKIKITGLRQGEKLFEELISKDEKKIYTSHPDVFLIESKILSYKKRLLFIKWVMSIPNMSDPELVKGIKYWVPEYKKVSN